LEKFFYRPAKYTGFFNFNKRTNRENGAPTKIQPFKKPQSQIFPLTKGVLRASVLLQKLKLQKITASPKPEPFEIAGF